MNSKPVHALLVAGLLGLAAGCEPAGTQDLKLTAPPGAASPQASDAGKVRSLTYTFAQSDAALAYVVAELGAQGFKRCENAQTISWAPHVLERDGKRVNTMRRQELLFLRTPPRIATVDLARVPEGVLVTVAIEQMLTGEIVVTRRTRFCPTGK